MPSKLNHHTVIIAAVKQSDQSVYHFIAKDVQPIYTDNYIWFCNMINEIETQYEYMHMISLCIKNLT